MHLIHIPGIRSFNRNVSIFIKKEATFNSFLKVYSMSYQSKQKTLSEFKSGHKNPLNIDLKEI